MSTAVSRGMVVCVIPRHFTAGVVIGTVCTAVCGQQFQHETNTRFPSPHWTEYTNQLSIADVNNDGGLDIAWANGCCFSFQGGAQRARLYMNDGAGFFTEGTDDRLGVVQGWFRGVEFGDINSNGRLDMALANDFNNLPVLMVNEESEVEPGVFDAGFFVNETASRLPNIPMSSSRVQFADFDNDGHLDLFFVNGGTSSRFGTGLCRLFLNDGQGFFTNASSNLPSATVTGPMDAQIGDINNDFFLDVRVGALNFNQSKLFVNNGDGTFTNASASVPSDANCYAYDMADIDGNGTLDMLGVNASPSGSQELLLRNNGNGTWTNISGQINNNLSIDDNDSKFIDFNNDGHLDLIIGAIGGNQERLYRGSGTGIFAQVVNQITPIQDATLDISVGDLTGNGKLDVVTAQGESGNFTNRIYVNTGPADTIPPKIVETEQLEDTSDTTGPYVVRAIISDSHTSDRNFFDKGIHVNYSHDGGAIQQVPMKWVGGMVYRAEIPGQSPGLIEYFVTAVDHNSNLGTGETVEFVVEGSEPIPGDLNKDGVVDVFDLLDLLAAWGDCKMKDCPGDLTGDGVVDVFDLLDLLANWG